MSFSRHWTKGWGRADRPTPILILRSPAYPWQVALQQCLLPLSPAQQRSRNDQTNIPAKCRPLTIRVPDQGKLTKVSMLPFVLWPPNGLSAVVGSSGPAAAALRWLPPVASSLHASAGTVLRQAAAAIPGGNPGGSVSFPLGMRREDSLPWGSEPSLRNFEGAIPGLSWE